MSARIEGEWRACSAACQHSTVSTLSAGRNSSRLGIARSDGEMLDRLVRRAVLAEADRIMGEDMDHPHPHQRREPQRGPGVIGEDEEARARGDEAAVHGMPLQAAAMPCSRMPQWM